jgi:hypothetical protein
MKQEVRRSVYHSALMYQLLPALWQKNPVE